MLLFHSSCCVVCTVCGMQTLLGAIEQIKDYISLQGRKGAKVLELKTVFKANEVVFNNVMHNLKSSSSFSFRLEGENELVVACDEYRNHSYGIITLLDIPSEPAYSLLEIVAASGIKGVLSTEACILMNIKGSPPCDKLIALGLVVKRAILPLNSGNVVSRINSRTTIFHLKRFAASYDPSVDGVTIEKGDSEINFIYLEMENILNEHFKEGNVNGVTMKYIPVTDMSKYLGITNRHMQYLRQRSTHRIESLTKLRFFEYVCNSLTVTMQQGSSEKLVWCIGYPANIATGTGNNSAENSITATGANDLYTSELGEDGDDEDEEKSAIAYGSGCIRNMSCIEQAKYHIDKTFDVGATSIQLRDLMGLSVKRSCNLGIAMVKNFGVSSLKSQEGKIVVYRLFGKDGYDARLGIISKNTNLDLSNNAVICAPNNIASSRPSHAKLLERSVVLDMTPIPNKRYSTILPSCDLNELTSKLSTDTNQLISYSAMNSEVNLQSPIVTSGFVASDTIVADLHIQTNSALSSVVSIVENEFGLKYQLITAPNYRIHPVGRVNHIMNEDSSQLFHHMSIQSISRITFLFDLLNQRSNVITLFDFVSALRDKEKAEGSTSELDRKTANRIIEGLISRNLLIQLVFTVDEVSLEDSTHVNESNSRQPRQYILVKNEFDSDDLKPEELGVRYFNDLTNAALLRRIPREKEKKESVVSRKGNE